MKLSVVAALAAASLLAVGPANAAGRNTGFTVSGQGEGRWKIACVIADAQGLISRPEIRGRRGGEQRTLTKAFAESADCTYEAGPAATLNVAFTGESFVCPFTATGDACAMTTPAGGSGSFHIRLKK